MKHHEGSVGRRRREDKDQAQCFSTHPIKGRFEVNRPATIMLEPLLYVHSSQRDTWRVILEAHGFATTHLRQHDDARVPGESSAKWCSPVPCEQQHQPHPHPFPDANKPQPPTSQHSHQVRHWCLAAQHLCIAPSHYQFLRRR